MKKSIFFLLAIVFCFYSCGSGAYNKTLNGGYFLSALNNMEDMYLGYQDGENGIGIITATVFAVGQNDDYIILKQHPRDFPNKPDKSIVNFYLIPLKSNISKSIDKNYYGPLTLREFEQKKKELGIKNIEFNKVFSSLE